MGGRAAKEAQLRALWLRARDSVGRSLWLLGLSGDPCIREPPLLWSERPVAHWDAGHRVAGRSCSLQAEPRQKRAEEMAGAAEEKPTKDAARSPPPPSLWSSNSLILNLRLPPLAPSHPILTTQTHTHTCTVHAVTTGSLPLIPKPWMARRGQNPTAAPSGSPTTGCGHWEAHFVWPSLGLSLSWSLSLFLILSLPLSDCVVWLCVWSLSSARWLRWYFLFNLLFLKCY